MISRPASSRSPRPMGSNLTLKLRQLWHQLFPQLDLKGSQQRHYRRTPIWGASPTRSTVSQFYSYASLFLRKADSAPSEIASGTLLCLLPRRTALPLVLRKQPSKMQRLTTAPRPLFARPGPAVRPEKSGRLSDRTGNCLPRTAHGVEPLRRRRLPNDPPQLEFPPLQRRALFGPELVLVVDGVGNAASTFNVQPGSVVLRNAEAGEVGAECAAQS